MPLPVGIWKANVNGFESPLQINAPNQSGTVTGTFSNFDFVGFWDEASQTITFLVTLAIDNPGAPVVAVFKGFLFRAPNLVPGQDAVATLTGFVQVTAGNHLDGRFVASSRRNEFGWLAQITEVN